MSNSPLRGFLARAEEFATLRHLHQFRRDGKTPYVEHPKAVMGILRDEFGVTDPEVLATGLLHDTIEDTATDFDDVEREFGASVARRVAALTKDKRLSERARERAYFQQLRRASIEVKLCKLADALHNLRDSTPRMRAKSLRKARGLVRLFKSTLPTRWAHALFRLTQEIERSR